LMLNDDKLYYTLSIIGSIHDTSITPLDLLYTYIKNRTIAVGTTG